MEILFEVLKVILPAIIAGLFTFFVTKYTYNSNRPLDKMEVAYSRIYYPLYKIVSDKKMNDYIDEVIKKSKLYFAKYDKYVDVSTKRIFENLCNCNKEAKRKSIYQRFKENIYDRNSYLRRRLGYLEPNFWQLYKYATPTSKSLFRITIELCVMYISLIVYSITMNISSIISNISATVFAIFLLVIIGEIVWFLLRFLYYKVRK